MDISSGSDKKIKLSVPCLFCKQNHGYNVSESVFFNTVVLYVESVGNSSSFRVGDCIMSINGTAIESKSQYNAMLSQLTIGENATVEIVRNNRQYSLTVPVVENTQNY